MNNHEDNSLSRRSVIVGAAAAAFTSLCPGRASAQCKAGDVVWDETDTEYICHRASRTDLPTCGSVPSSVDAIGRQRDSLRRQLQQNTREAIRNADELETWSAFLSKQREEARKKAAGQAGGIVLSETLNRLTAKATAARQLRTQQAGLMRREWGAQVDRLSRMSPTAKAYWLGRINEAKTAEQGLTVLNDGIEAINQIYDVGSLYHDTNWKELKLAVLGTLNIAVTIAARNPAISMLKTDFEAGENALYGWWSVLAARNRLKQFCALEDKLLAQQVKQSNRYVLLSNALNAIKLGHTYCVP